MYGVERGFVSSGYERERVDRMSFVTSSFPSGYERERVDCLCGTEARRQVHSLTLAATSSIHSLTLVATGGRPKSWRGRCGFSVLAFAVCVVAAAAAEPRQTQVIEGVTFEYAPEREPVVRALVPLVADLNREIAARPPPPAAPVVLFSPKDLRANRARYIAQIAAAIGLEKPTALQEECYDAFLESVERTDRLLELMTAKMRESAQLQRIVIWDKPDLIRRLKAGETLPVFTLDPDGEGGRFEWKGDWSGLDQEIGKLFADRQQRRLDYSYNLNSKDGVVSLSGHFRPRAPAKLPVTPPPVETAPARAPAASEVLPLPIIIKAEEAALAPADLAATGVTQFRRVLEEYGRVSPAMFQPPSTLALLIFHETAEVGVVDRYIGSADRRWLCDGVANYVAWKVARDAGGEAPARQVYNLPAQLARHAALREKIDLRKWPAVEKQRKEDADTPLNLAHYAFATRAVFAMAERHGEDFLPKLFREIGATPRAKTNMRTVENAYQKLTRRKLDTVLREAVAPIAPAAK